VWSIRDIGPSVGQPCEDVAVKTILISVTVLLVSTGLASAAEPIVGNWKTTLGDTAAIEPCGGGFCITLKNGKHAGEKIGAFEGGGGSYSGKITDPDAKKTYNGTISVSGDTVTLKGCVMKVVCESQKWSRQ
jgi:uncharacterized protein (DUF2147 family)